MNDLNVNKFFNDNSFEDEFYDNSYMSSWTPELIDEFCEYEIFKESLKNDN